MSERAQIDVRQGDKVIRIYSGWGTPRNILPALRAAASAGHSKPLAIAREIVRHVHDSGFGLRIIAEDYDRSNLDYSYTVDVSSTPWRVRQTRMAGYAMPTNSDGSCDDSFSEDNFLPAVTRSFRIK